MPLNERFAQCGGRSGQSGEKNSDSRVQAVGKLGSRAPGVETFLTTTGDGVPTLFRLVCEGQSEWYRTG